MVQTVQCPLRILYHVAGFKLLLIFTVIPTVLYSFIMSTSKKEDEVGNQRSSVFTDIEEVYTHIGRYGLSQMVYLNILSIMNMSAALNFLSGVYLILAPSWECVSGTSCNESSNICELNETDWNWIDKDSTMIGYFGLHCRRNYATLASSLFFIPGTVVGLGVSGYASDRFGRKITVLVSLVLTLLVSIGLAATSNFVVFLVCRSFIGVTCAGYMGVYFTYKNEFFDASSRPMAGFIGTIYKVFGMLVLPLVSYLFPWWRSIHIANCIIVVVCFVVALIPESPQWLLANSKPEECAEVLARMSRWNRKPIHVSQIKIRQDKVDSSQKKDSGNLTVIFRNKTNLLLTLNFFYQWCITSLMFYGFYYALESISGSVNTNFAIMAVLEIPFNFVCSVLMNFAGRKKSLLLSLLVIIICCFLTFIPWQFSEDWDLKRVATIIGSKWGTASCFLIIYLYTNEVMPTSIRCTGLHLCSISARVGSFIAPYVVNACMNLSSYTQNIVFIAISVIGVICVFALPETKNVAFKATEFTEKSAQETDI